MSDTRRLAQQGATAILNKLLQDQIDEIRDDLKRTLPEMVGECRISGKLTIVNNNISMVLQFDLTDRAWDEMVPDILAQMSEGSA